MNLRISKEVIIKSHADGAATGLGSRTFNSIFINGRFECLSTDNHTSLIHFSTFMETSHPHEAFNFSCLLTISI